MTITEIKSEIETSLKKYDEAGLVDYYTIDLLLKRGLKRFGNNIMQLKEKTIEVSNKRATLPEDFWRLYVAAYCKPDGYNVKKGSKEILMSSAYWKQRIENDYEWDNETELHTKKGYKEIIEKEYFKGTEVDLRYTKPIYLLKIVDGFRSEACSKDCLNLKSVFKTNEEKTVNLVRNTIYTNFDDGAIYTQYYGLPTNEEGDIVVDSPNGHLEEFLQYYCIRKTLEDLILSGDGNIKNEVSYFKSLEEEAYTRAMTESKFNSLGQFYDRRLRNRNRAVTMKFEYMFPNI